MMQAGSMKALVGAATNINLVNTPMSVYRKAEGRGDTETMKRALGYADELSENAEKDAAKLGEETIKEAREARKQQETEREQAIAKARQKNKTEREQGLNSSENSAVKSDKITNSATAEIQAKDRVEISDSGKAAIAGKMLSDDDVMFVQSAGAEIYSGSGQAQLMEQPRSVVMDIMV